MLHGASCNMAAVENGVSCDSAEYSDAAHLCMLFVLARMCITCVTVSFQWEM